MKKNISILGATGSVGLNTLKIIDAKKKDFKIILLSANKNYKLICKQIKKYKPKYYIINNYFIFKLVEKKFKNKKIEILNNFKFNFKEFLYYIFYCSIITGLLFSIGQFFVLSQ